MHQIDETKDSAMYNAYMGVDDVGYKHPLNDERHRYYGSQRPKPYASRRMHTESASSTTHHAPPPPHVPSHGALNRTQSSPAMYYPKNRHSPSYNNHSQYREYNTPHAASYYAYSHHPHAPHSSHPHPHHHHPPGPHYNEGAPHHYPPPPKSYQAPPTQSDPYNYYTQKNTPHYPHYSGHFQGKSDKSNSPQIMHIPSKVAKSSQAVQRHQVPQQTQSKSPVMMEVPSLLSKAKKKKEVRQAPSPLSPLEKIEDIATTKLEEVSDVVDISEIKTPKFPLSRQYSEPDAKAMRDLERDLNALPLTPPFDPHGNIVAPATPNDEMSALGLPTNLMYAKTTPLTLNEHENNHQEHPNQYGNVNDVYNMKQQQNDHHYQAQRNYAYHQQQPQQRYMIGGYNNEDLERKKLLKKQHMENNKKKQREIMNMMMMQQMVATNATSAAAAAKTTNNEAVSFDFETFDLNEQLKNLKKELAELDEQIASTDSKMRICENNLKETKEEKTAIFARQKKEKLVLQKSLNLDDDDSEKEAISDEKMREFWAKQSKDLHGAVERLRTKNMAVAASADVMHKHLRSQLDSTRKQLVSVKTERERNRNRNMQFELEVIELTESVNNLKENVDCQRHDNFLALSKQKEREMIYDYEEEESGDNDDDDDDNKEGKKRNKIRKRMIATEYPPEIVIQENLIRAQVEFYFSDYNLKRDKRLLEKICKEPQRGYLSVTEVLGLSRVRQLCNTSHQLYDALKSSMYIDMILSAEEEEKLRKKGDDDDDDDKVVTIEDDKGDGEEEESEKEEQYHPLFIGRRNFSPPTEKQFPFRRSVYIYGLPWYADDKYIYAMLNAFGGVTKVHFDHGPDTLDRQIMKKMLEKHRVYKLLSKDSAALTMEFNAMHREKEQYHCYWCRKQKACADGYYHPKRIPGSAPSYRVCLQCAAAKAEEQCSKYDARSKLLKDDKRLRELLLGLPPRPTQQCKTALCVFASQRQASKCVYVRSRLAYDGAFATHYHHYSKLKKEIALSIKPKIKLINSYHHKQTSKPSMRSVKTAPVYESEGTAVLQQ